jgi:concanavalin A-like lectin/glucanase superfamily protein
MNRTKGRSLCWLVAAVTAAVSAGPAAEASAGVNPAAASVQLIYNMNEPSGASVMQDSGPLRLNGHIGSEVMTGVSSGGAIGYQFPRLTPNVPPAHPQHLVTIPDNDAVDPGSGNYSVEIRYKTTNGFGNLIQKGQSTTAGGQFKIQLPGGKAQCYFKGPLGKDGVGYQVPLDDGQFHTLLCVKTASSVTLYVDGVKRATKTGPIGTMNNTFPVSIGGKPQCDQIKVTCDYFGGIVDYVKITKG